MSRTCTVCRHESAAEIDAALIRGEPERSIAARFGAVSRDAIQRHRRHLPVVSVDSGDALLADVLMLQRHLWRIMTDSEKRGAAGVAVAAGRELVRVLALRHQMSPAAFVPAEFERWAAALAASLGYDPQTFLTGLRQDMVKYGYVLPSMADSVENHPRVSDG